MDKIFQRKNLSPNFEELKNILKGERKPEKVYFVELIVDSEVMKFITENIMAEKWVSPPDILTKKSTVKGEFSFDERVKKLWKQHINFYYRMGYDYVPGEVLWSLISSMYSPKARICDDTAILSRGKRNWVEEGKGIITSWQDFEKFPWKELKSSIRSFNFEEYDKFLGENLPEGMKITTVGCLYEEVLEHLLGYEGLFYSLYDKPDLVKAVFDAWGEVIYELYESAISMESVGGIFHADDLGYKTGTMLSPDFLRRNVFPWFKEYASLAHQEGKMFWLHSCGNLTEVMEDLIEDIEIDAFHSFQDVIIPVGEFKKRYGDRIAVLGGVDMDKLGRLDEHSLRRYIRGILDECMPGRYTLGSGNTIANYIPVRNYLIMLEEGARWR